MTVTTFPFAAFKDSIERQAFLESPTDNFGVSMRLKLWTSTGLLVLVLLLLTSRAAGSPYQRKICTEPTKDVPYSCGTRPLFPDSRQKSTKILGGHDAAYGSNPWQANLYAKMEDESTIRFCGGTILNEYWVLTAGHCDIDGAIEFFIYVGDNYLGYDYEEEEQRLTVEKIILHEKFLHIPETNTSKFTIRNDIALMKIKPVNGRGIQFGNYVQPACLPDADTKLKPDQKFTISGWGMTKPDVSPDTLQETLVTLKDTYGYCTFNKKDKNYNPDLMLCAPTLNNNTCRGDSGGPLVANVNGVYQVFGVTSYGFGECKFVVSYFTKVQAYLDWIYFNIMNNSENDGEKFLPSSPTFQKIM
ncbi:chymotrypsinogen B-like [Physella acuta]|uniref:chymotrypsinogen B-like n=1 Tax=Physella acuta TaxID=109671 RepID=UPI0027DAC0A8|nr:chymotrypsinogen B-like [Physella acuta]